MASAWLVDMGYVVKTASKGLFKVDYVAAEQIVRERFGDATSFLFNSYDEAYGIADGLQRFYDGMWVRGMHICLQPMSGHVATGDHRQRRVDVDLAAHIVWQASQTEIDWVIATAGDQDFVPAVSVAKAQFDVRFGLLTYRRDVSGALREIADDHLYFEDYEDRVRRD